jgi:hypothetical protein
MLTGSQIYDNASTSTVALQVCTVVFGQFVNQLQLPRLTGFAVKPKMR